MSESGRQPRAEKEATGDAVPSSKRVRKRESSTLSKRHWGVVLAGGDGVRLRSLTQFISGDDRPKQFCPLLGKRTLLQEACRKAERSILFDQILVSLTHAHHGYFSEDLADCSVRQIVQPSNKGTAPAILHALLLISQIDSAAVVAILPCDHYYSREDEFSATLEKAFSIAASDIESIVLLGVRPTTAETAYGWIELGERIDFPICANRVKEFHEKPSRRIAENLLRNGSLWNTFVMVGCVNAFLDLASETVPDLLGALRPAGNLPTWDTLTSVLGDIYQQINPVDFSRDVLSRRATRLIALQLKDAKWNDLGDPNRVIATLLGNKKADLPSWVRRWRDLQEV